MRSLLTAAVPLCLAVVVSGAYAQSPPRAEVAGGDVLDFGRVRPSRAIRTMHIVNTGGDTLRLGNISSGCGCLAGQPDRAALGRGDTSRLTVTIETTGSVADRWEKVLSIGTNDPLRPTLRVTVTADLTRDVRIESQLATIRDEPCPAVGCLWEIVVANTSDSTITVFAPVMEEVRGLTVVLDRDRPVELPPGARQTYVARVAPADSEAVPMARLLFLTSSPFDRELRASFFLTPR